jgi:fatty-acyl-CoA synthase
MSSSSSASVSLRDSIVKSASLSAEPGIGALTIPAYLREITTRFGPREALVMRSRESVIRWSYAQLWDRSVELARALLAAGVGKDSRVGVLMSNRPEFIIAAFAVAMAGGVTVVLSTFSTAPELEHLLRVSGASILLYEPRVARKDFDAVLLEVEPAIKRAGPLWSARLPFLRRIVRLDAPEAADHAGVVERTGGAEHARSAVERWSHFLQGAASVPLSLLESAAQIAKPSDAALLFFSSGTTGLPKGILHTHRAAAIQWWRWPRIIGVSGPQTSGKIRCWTANAFSWSGQFSMALGCSLSTGGTAVLQSTFEPEDALELFEAERVTLPFAWPHQWAKLRQATNWSSVDLSSLYYVDPRSPLAQHPTVRPPAVWYEPPAYGATETFTIVAAHPDFEPAPGREHLQGPVLPANTLKIVDPFSGTIVPRGARGEIAVKGSTLMLGYIGTPPDETFDAEGFFHTGDGGYLDESGQLFWEGRLSDIIKTGGANVSPREIDGILSAYPGVRLSRTVGIPHDTLGEMVVACLVPQDGAVLQEAVMRDFLRARLASYKVPRRLLFFKQEEIAMTGTDKVKADVLVRQVTARLAFEKSRQPDGQTSPQG